MTRRVFFSLLLAPFFDRLRKFFPQRHRALRLRYTFEPAKDLVAIHGLDAEAELASMLSAEILKEINKEIIRSIYKVA